MNIISKYLIILLCTYLFSQNVSAQSDRQYIRSGNNFYRQENYFKAEIEFRKALNKNPQNPQALYNLGCALLQQKKDSLAILQLQYAGKLETSKIRKAMIFHNIGVICQRHHLFGEAIEAYKESLRNNPLDNETRYNLVLCMRQRKPSNNKEKSNKNKDKDKNKSRNNLKPQSQNREGNQVKQGKYQEQQKTEEMNKANVEQLLNYAIQEEKSTQQRLNRNKSTTQSRKLRDNW